jgi:hypothetical protein
MKKVVFCASAFQINALYCFPPILAEWRNWQTRRTQNPVPARACRFKSDLGYPGENMSNFKEYLDKQGIDPRRVLVASKKLESLQPEDRAIKLLLRNKKKDENAKKEEGDRPKPRSGRPVTGPMIDRAIKGDDLSGAAKTRILRAVNAVLKQKKKQEASLADLF